MNIILRQLESLQELWKIVPREFTIGKQKFQIVLSPIIGASNFFEFYDESEWEFGMSENEVKVARRIKPELCPLHEMVRLSTQEDIFQEFLSRFPDIYKVYQKYFPKYQEIAMVRSLTAFGKMLRVKTFADEPIFDDILKFYETADIQNDSQSHIFPQMNGEIAHKNGFDAIIPCTGNALVDDGRFIRVFCEIQADLSAKIRKIQRELFVYDSVSARLRAMYLPQALGFRFQHKFMGTPQNEHWCLRKNRGNNDVPFNEFVHHLDKLIEQDKFTAEEIVKFKPSM